MAGEKSGGLRRRENIDACRWNVPFQDLYKRKCQHDIPRECRLHDEYGLWITHLRQWS